MGDQQPRQVPDAEKRRRGDHVVDSGLTMEEKDGQRSYFCYATQRWFKNRYKDG